MAQANVDFASDGPTKLAVSCEEETISKWKAQWQITRDNTHGARIYSGQNVAATGCKTSIQKFDRW